MQEECAERGKSLELRSLDKNSTKWKTAIAAGLLLAALPFTASASPIVFTGSGTGTSGQGIAASVTFAFVQHNFGSGLIDAVEIQLRNTASVTLVRGNLITGLFFSLSPTVGNLITGANGFNGLAQTVVNSNGTISTNVDLGPAVNGSSTDGTYQLSNGPFGIANSSVSYAAFRYGISTVGGGLAGFSGQAVNSDDYGIFASGSNVTGGGLASARPLIDSIATFWVARPGGWTREDQVTGVRVAYGSLPDNYLDLPRPPTSSVPEPSSLALLGLGSVALAWGKRKSRVS